MQAAAARLSGLTRALGSRRRRQPIDQLLLLLISSPDPLLPPRISRLPRSSNSQHLERVGLLLRQWRAGWTVGCGCGPCCTVRVAAHQRHGRLRSDRPVGSERVDLALAVRGCIDRVTVITRAHSSLFALIVLTLPARPFSLVRTQQHANHSIACRPTRSDRRRPPHCDRGSSIGRSQLSVSSERDCRIRPAAVSQPPVQRHESARRQASGGRGRRCR